MISSSLELGISNVYLALTYSFKCNVLNYGIETFSYLDICCSSSFFSSCIDYFSLISLHNCVVVALNHLEANQIKQITFVTPDKHFEIIVWQTLEMFFLQKQNVWFQWRQTLLAWKQEWKRICGKYRNHRTSVLVSNVQEVNSWYWCT